MLPSDSTLPSSPKRRSPSPSLAPFFDLRLDDALLRDFVLDVFFFFGFLSLISPDDDDDDEDEEDEEDDEPAERAESTLPSRFGSFSPFN